MFYHLGISHVTELLLHLLFGCGFGVHGCLGISLCGHSVNNLFDEGGCVCLSVEIEGIGGNGQLTPFHCLLRSLK